MENAILTEMMLVISFAQIGLVALIRPNILLNYYDGFKAKKANELILLIFPFIFLFAYFAAAHQVFDYELSLITTIIIYGAVLKCFLILLFPDYTLNLMAKIKVNKAFIRIEGIIILILTYFIYTGV